MKVKILQLLFNFIILWNKTAQTYNPNMCLFLYTWFFIKYFFKYILYKRELINFKYKWNRACAYYAIVKYGLREMKNKDNSFGVLKCNNFTRLVWNYSSTQLKLFVDDPNIFHIYIFNVGESYYCNQLTWSTISIKSVICVFVSHP